MERSSATSVPHRRPRIALAGLMHETNTFAPFLTTLADFRQRALLRGDDLIRAAARGPGALAGAVAAAGDVSLVPLIFASATPGGPVTDDTWAGLSAELLDRLRLRRRTWPGVDGVVLFLHGAMVTESDPDPEGTLLARVRAEIGPHTPLVAVIDSHATLTERMVAMTDALVAYREYPHVDTFERGEEAMRLCLDLVDRSMNLHRAWRKLPLMMPLLSQATIPASPFYPVVALANHWRQAAGITSISLVPGFPYADVPGAGAAVVVHGADPAIVRQAAEELATAWWEQRSKFTSGGTPLAELPGKAGQGPTVLAEICDNPGAGAAGDATHLLRHLLEGQYQKAALAALHDPLSVAACHSAGVGATLTLSIGGRTHESSGPPVTAPWTVIHLGDGVFINEGRMSPGAHGRLGRTATVQCGGLSVILTEQRAQALDPGVFRAGGVKPEHCHWLAVKSSVHYRAGFQILAGRMIDVECAGLSPSSLQSLEYSRVKRPMAPLDDTDWSRAASVMETRP